MSPIDSTPSPLRPVAGIRDVALRAAEECEIGDTPVEKQDSLFKIFKKIVETVDETKRSGSVASTAPLAHRAY
ncbi:MAG: hypothetical protein ACOYMN_16860 [Roseimicrobium sp.]